MVDSGMFLFVLAVYGRPDEEDTFTSHLPIRDIDTDVTKIDPREGVYENLGGTCGPFSFEIDGVS
jgi:hypothetical protein